MQHEDGFYALIGPCANLKSFEYFHRECPEDDGYNEFFDVIWPGKSVRSLEVRGRDTLGTFCLDYSYGSYKEGFPLSNYRLPSFTGFKVLKHLRLRVANILGLDEEYTNPFMTFRQSPRIPLTQILPQSLESL